MITCIHTGITYRFSFVVYYPLSISGITLYLRINVPFFPLIVFGHVNLNKVSAYDSIKNTTNKVLVIHGDSDVVVPHFISEDLFRAYPNKIQYELFKGANHGMSYLVDKPRYQKIIKDFLDN